MKKTFAFLLMIFLALNLSALASATVINYTDFSDLSDFTLNGITATINTGGTGVIGPDGSRVLRLTDNLGQSGSAFLTDPILLQDAGGFQASFSTAFEFQFTGQQNGGADGIVFVVQTVANNVGGGGGGIGYQGIQNSLGIEFDNWFNAGSDSNSSHVGIDLNGNVSSVASASVSPDLDNGDIWYAWADYDGTNDLLEVRLSTTNSRPATATLNYTVDLVSVLGTPEAFIGFTSGTGAAGADHDIRAWQFINTFDPIEDGNTVPEPATMLLLGSGLVGLAGFRRRFKRG
jgi:hypothetical protein